MKIGIFADIHGNIYAFEKAFRSLVKENLDLYLFCGDICGYYYYQNEVIDMLQGMKNLVCVAGNHDRIFLSILKGEGLEEYTSRYGKACMLLKDNIAADNLLFLKGLPRKYISDRHGFAVFHGSPWNHLEGYMYPDADFNAFKKLDFKFVFLGHTHYSMDIKSGKARVINPGSVGQPRDGNLPSYAVVDTGRNSLRFKRFNYEVSGLLKDIRARKEENTYLIDVLKRMKAGK